MSTTAAQDDVTVDSDHTGDGPPVDLSVLQDRIPDWLRLSRAVAVLTAVLGVVFVMASYHPLWHTDVWGHLSYGRWIWQHGRLPATEPLLPLCQGVPMVDPAWLSQLLAFGLYSALGVTALQFLFAACITLASALLAGAIWNRTGSLVASLVGVAAALWANYQQLLVARPQLAGLVCFSAVLVIATSRRSRRSDLVLVPAIFAVWANLHGSFPVGLALLGLLFVGRAVDILFRTRTARALLHDRQIRRLLLLTELAAVAVLINPYGFRLYLAVVGISQNPNLQDLIEWDPLTLRMSQGRAAAVVSLALIILYRLSPRRVSAGEFLVLAVFGAATLWTSRMIHWWAPLAGFYLALHLAAVLRKYRGRYPAESPATGLWSLVSVGLAWIFFAYTPFGYQVLHGRNMTAEQQAARFRKSVSRQTPIAASEYLHRHPPQGQVFNTYEWGDYLLWAGPPGTQLFLNSHAHLVPEEVWQDYLRIAAGATGWDDKLDRYGVNTVVVDKRGRKNLIRRLKKEPGTWKVGYEDNVSAVFLRRNPI